MSQFKEAIEAAVDKLVGESVSNDARFKINSLRGKAPRGVIFKGVRTSRDGETYVSVEFPRWYRHPDENPEMEETEQYRQVANFERELEDLLHQLGLDDIGVAAGIYP